jgi:hypothetical protein
LETQHKNTLNIKLAQYGGCKKKCTMVYKILSLQCYATIWFINDDKMFKPVGNWQQNQWALNSTFKTKIVFGYVNGQHTWACANTMNLSLIVLLQTTTTPIRFKSSKKYCYILKDSDHHLQVIVQWSIMWSQS